MDYTHCRLCPRQCGVNRLEAAGFCRCGSSPRVARAALHFWEEPCISGVRGSGTVFFSGCTLKCCFCQNYSISSGGFGKDIDVRRLGDIFLELEDKGAHNINLVTPTQYLPSILAALDLVRHRLTIPIVYNSGGYERPETIRELDGYVDIYLPDLKYFDSSLSGRYSAAPDYFSFASRAISAMIRQTGAPVLAEEEGCTLMKKGVIIRHMVLPGQKEDSKKLLRWMKESLPEGHFFLSLLSQYTPFFRSSEFPEINRRITTYEYNQVLDFAISLGLTAGFMQKKSSAREEYTPPFDLEGVDPTLPPSQDHR
ncbi:MAG TPA: radical SAM protein [Candidatus Lachnoclostridium avicola]|nr:radical SAM protein [Candidatus Lachnoclostridium avicola]